MITQIKDYLPAAGRDYPVEFGESRDLVPEIAIKIAISRGTDCRI